MHKKDVMSGKTKFVSVAVTVASFAFSVTSVAQAQPVSNLTIYAGPQSVSPGELIYVTVEGRNFSGQSLAAERVELSYIRDGEPTLVFGTFRDGLASFEVPAQNLNGLMSFSAKSSGAKSNNAEILVVSGPPQEFSIKSHPVRNGQGIELTSDKIADEYGNPISDLSLISINWMDQFGIKERHSVQPRNGYIFLLGQCPEAFSPPLMVQASVSTVASDPINVTALCGEALS